MAVSLATPAWRLPLALLPAVFRLALRQTEGLIGSILALLGLDLAVPNHSTLSLSIGEEPGPRSASNRAPCSPTEASRGGTAS